MSWYGDAWKKTKSVADKGLAVATLGMAGDKEWLLGKDSKTERQKNLNSTQTSYMKDMAAIAKEQNPLTIQALKDMQNTEATSAYNSLSGFAPRMPSNYNVVNANGSSYSQLGNMPVASSQYNQLGSMPTTSSAYQNIGDFNQEFQDRYGNSMQKEYSDQISNLQHGNERHSSGRQMRELGALGNHMNQMSQARSNMVMQDRAQRQAAQENFLQRQYQGGMQDRMAQLASYDKASLSNYEGSMQDRMAQLASANQDREMRLNSLDKNAAIDFAGRQHERDNQLNSINAAYNRQDAARQFALAQLSGNYGGSQLLGVTPYQYTQNPGNSGVVGGIAQIALAGGAVKDLVK